MKKVFLLPVIISIFILLACSQAACAAKDTDKGGSVVEEEIWKLEEAYFSNLYRAGHEAVLALVHEQFFGWPDATAQPLDKQGSASFMKEAFSRPSSCSITIERKGIRIVENAALTQYIIHTSCGNANEAAKKQSSRITHTWVKEGPVWKLLGGMSIGSDR